MRFCGYVNLGVVLGVRGVIGFFFRAFSAAHLGMGLRDLESCFFSSGNANVGRGFRGCFFDANPRGVGGRPYEELDEREGRVGDRDRRRRYFLGMGDRDM